MEKEKKLIIDRIAKTLEKYQDKTNRQLASMIYHDYLEPSARPEDLVKSGAKRTGSTRRNLTLSMVEGLEIVVTELLERHEPINRIFKTRDYVSEKKHLADFAKLRHWGFLERYAWGMWQLTDKAIAFIKYNEPAYRYIYEANGRVTWKSHEAITYKELKRKTEQQWENKNLKKEIESD